MSASGIPTSVDDATYSNSFSETSMDFLGVWKSDQDRLGLGLELHTLSLTYTELRSQNVGTTSEQSGFSAYTIAPGLRYSKRHFINQYFFVQGSGDALLPILLNGAHPKGNDRIKFRQVDLAGRA